MKKVKIELLGNHFINGLPYKAGIHNLPEGIVKQFDKVDYKVLSKSNPKKKTRKKTKEMKVDDKPTGYSDKAITAKDFGIKK